jgi:hypothetical protein
MRPTFSTTNSRAAHGGFSAAWVRKTGFWNPDSTGDRLMAGGNALSGVSDALGRVGSGCGVSGTGESVGVETETGESVGWAEGKGWVVADGTAVTVGTVLGVGVAGRDVLVGRDSGVGRAGLQATIKMTKPIHRKKRGFIAIGVLL